MIRDLVAETTLDAGDLVAPLFVAEGIDAPRPIASSDARIAATWPSIMPLGATTSAPASAWATAILA